MTSKLPNLLPLEAYKVNQFNYWTLEVLLIAAWFGGWNFVGQYWATRPIDAFFAITTSLGSFFPGIIGATVSRSMRASVWEDYFYKSGIGQRLMESAPRSCVYQLPCLHCEGIWRDTGILFFTPTHLRFVAQRGLLRRPAPIELLPLETVVAQPSNTIANWWRRIPLPSATKAIEITWRGGRVLLWTPDPAEAVAQITRAVETLSSRAR